MVHRLKLIRFETWLKWGLGTLVLASLLFAIPYKSLSAFLTFDRIIFWVESSRSNVWTMIGFFISFAFAILGFPVTIFPIIGGVLFPFWVAFPLNIAAETLGALMAFGLARFFGRSAVESFLRGKGQMFDRFASHEGIKTVLLVRVSGFPPFVLANYLLGLSGVKLRDYVMGTLIGITPWTALMTALANVFWQAALQGGQKGLMKAVVGTMAPLSGISILILLAIGASAYWRRKKKLHSNL